MTNNRHKSQGGKKGHGGKKKVQIVPRVKKREAENHNVKRENKGLWEKMKAQEPRRKMKG